MRRVALLAGLLTLWTAAPAAGWIELSPRPVPGDGVADCLRAAGPGQLALLAPHGRHSAIDVLSVGSHAIAPATTTPFGLLASCAEVGAAPGARPLLVAVVARGGRREVRTVRAAAPGARPATLGASSAIDDSPAVAQAPGGAAVVAWNELVLRPRLTLRVLAAVRPSAGAPFGPAVTLGSGGSLASAPSVAVDAAGRATVVWVSRGRLGGPSLVDIASTTAGGGFGPSQQLASAAGDRIALAVAPSGRTLVVNYGGGAIVAYERAAGASAFAPVPVPASGAGGALAVALADDGSAVIAYTMDLGFFAFGGEAPSAFVLLRRPGDAFGREQALEGSATGDSVSSFGFDLGSVLGQVTAPPSDDTGADIAAALGASGDVVVTWVDPGDRGGAASAHVARGTIAAGMSRGTRLGSPCRTANAARPWTLADGTLGAAWTDNAAVTSQDEGDTPRAGGLLHVVVPGQAPPPAAGAPPGLSADLIGSVALRGGQPLRLRVRCRRGPCVVRATATAYPLDSSYGDASLVDGSIEVPRGRVAVLSLAPGSGNTFARLHDASARVSLLACTTTSTRVARSALHLRLHRLPPLPLPRVLQLVARRHGSSVRVTWRTSIPARGVSFVVLAAPVDVTHVVYADIHGRGRSRFAVTLRVPPSDRPRSVLVQVIAGDRQDAGSASARIR